MKTPIPMMLYLPSAVMFVFRLPRGVSVGSGYDVGTENGLV